MTPLRQRMIDDLKLRNRSPRTIETYVGSVAHYAKFHGRSPDQLGEEEVRASQKPLIDSGASWNRYHQAVAALKFFYGVTLNVQRKLVGETKSPLDAIAHLGRTAK